MAYNTNHLLTVGHAKELYSNLKSANDAVARFDNTNTKYNTINRGNVMPQSIYGWHYGSISASTGADNNSNPVRIRSDYMPIKANTTYKVVGDGYVLVHFYTSDKTWISLLTSSWGMPTFRFVTPANAAYVRFLLKKGSAGTAEFTADDIAHIDMACIPIDNPLDNLAASVHGGNVFDAFATYASGTISGVKFTWDETNHEYSVNGTSTGSGDNPARITFYNSVLPSIFAPGGVYLLSIASESSSIGITITFYDGNGDAILNFWNRTASCYIYVPKNAVSIMARIETANGSTVSNKKFKFSLEYQEPTVAPVHIPCLTYNVGCYNYGYAPSAEHPIQATSVILAEMKEFFRTHKPDLFALQEGQDEIVDSDLTTETNAYTALYNYLYPYKITANVSGYLYSPTLFSKYPLIWAWSSAMSTGRRVARAIVNVHGIAVMIASVHLSLTAADRATDYAEIKSWMTSLGGFDHAIILGDFNAGNGVGESGWDATAEYAQMVSDGFHTANGDYWGLINTYAGSTQDAEPRYLDTIMTTANIDINTCDAPYLRSTMPGDHRPLLCDLVLYPTKAISR